MFHNAVVEISKTTSFRRELMDEGRKAGREEGVARRVGAIRSYLESTYPKLVNDRAIGRMATLEKADEVLKRLYRTRSETEAREILRGR